MTIIGDAASEHERLLIVLFLRGRATLVREVAAKIPGHISLAAEVAAATLEATALLIEAGEHEKWPTRGPTAHPPEPKALSADDALMEKLDRLVAALPARPDQDLVLKKNRVRWQRRVYDVKDVRVSEGGCVVGLEEGVTRQHGKPDPSMSTGFGTPGPEGLDGSFRDDDDWLENERSQINEDD